MNKRRALTFFVAVYVFAIMVITIVISFLGVWILLAFDAVPISEGGNADPLYTLLFMLVICLIVGSIVTSLSNKILLRYINRFLNQMNRLAAGDFSARLEFGNPIKNHPAVKEITDSFNTLANELEHTSLLRMDFINNFSHEFKTPIVSIAGFAKLLKRGNLTEEQKREYLDIIEEESLRLSAMATNVLNMTKVETQTILTDVTTYNLSEQIRSCVLLLENAWVHKNVDFNLNFQEIEIHANEELLKQVWINLVDNAIKFSPMGGEITISICIRNRQIEVAVANLGEEIPSESRKRIFDKFYQVDESHSSEGNGVGLAIVKKVIDLHHGSVKVECEDGITTFEVKLPQ